MISVIVPAYNVEGFIREALASVAAQSYADWECIVIDDGSTDGTLAVAEEFAAADPRFRLISHENRGPGARNTGLDNARGEWICFLDADDMLLPHALRCLIDLTRYGRLMVAAGWTRRPDFAPKPGRKPKITFYTPIQAIADMLYQRQLTPSVVAKLFHCSLFGSESFREGILYEDLDIMPRLVGRTNGVALSTETVYYYRVTPGSIMHTFNERRLDVLSVTDGIERFVAARYPDLLPAARSRRLSAAFNMYALIAAQGGRDEAITARADECMALIRAYRHSGLRDRRMRLKNRLALLLTYLGPLPMKLMAKWMYRN